MMFDDSPLVFRDVEAGYGRHQVLRRLELRLRKGSVCALLGRNGAGKTTLLRTALGFLKPRSGRAEVLGLDGWKDRFELKDRLGFVAERQDFWPRMRASELLDLASKLYSCWDPARAAVLVDRFGLGLSVRIGTYSKGMQVQLAQVVALAHEPELLLLDEPVAGMDPVVRTEFVEHILEYVHDTGASVLYSTHLVSEVESMADRVAFLHDGTIIIEGEVDDILSRYSRFIVVLDDSTRAAVARLEPVSIHTQEELAVITCAANPEELAVTLAELDITPLQLARPTLQELFIALLGEDNPRRSGSQASRRRREVA